MDTNGWHYVNNGTMVYILAVPPMGEANFSELITSQFRKFHVVSPQVVFTLLIFLITMQKLQVLPEYYYCTYPLSELN